MSSTITGNVDEATVIEALGGEYTGAEGVVPAQTVAALARQAYHVAQYTTPDGTQYVELDGMDQYVWGGLCF